MSHKDKTIFSNNQMSVGHFFWDSHLNCFTKLKQNSHFAKYILWNFLGMFVISDWNYKYLQQFQKYYYNMEKSNFFWKKVQIKSYSTIICIYRYAS